MKVHDWLYVGIKLLAVYFAVLGIVPFVVTVYNVVVDNLLALARSQNVLHHGASYNFADLVQPGCLIISAWFLGRNTGLVFKLLRVAASEQTIVENDGSILP